MTAAPAVMSNAASRSRQQAGRPNSTGCSRTPTPLFARRQVREADREVHGRRGKKLEKQRQRCGALLREDRRGAAQAQGRREGRGRLPQGDRAQSEHCRIRTATWRRIYNGQEKFDEAAEDEQEGQRTGRRERGRRRSPIDLYNQGVILWNAGKVEEARRNSPKAVQLDPKMAKAQYYLGLTTFSLAATGKVKMIDAKAPLEEYLKLEPNGEFADAAKAPARDDQVAMPPAGGHRVESRRRPTPGSRRGGPRPARPGDRHPPRRLQDV